MPSALKPLVPVPSDANEMVAVPLFAPALAVFTPTCNALLLPPAANNDTLPLDVAVPVVEILALRLSEKPSFAAVLFNVKACESVPPTRWLAKTTGFGVTALALARR